MPSQAEIDAAMDAVLKAAWKRGAKIGLGFNLHRKEVHEAIVIALVAAEKVRARREQAESSAIVERLRKL